MNKRKLLATRVCSFVLALLMVLTLVPAKQAQAATKKKNLTLYVGESIYYTDYYKVKKVSTSKKSIVSVSKDKQYNYRTNMTAKKPGKATVTIKTTRGTHKLNITVKKFDLSVSMKDMGHGYILVSVKNNTKQIFDSAYIAYSIVDLTGAEVALDSVRVNSLLPGKTSYATISYNQYSYTPDMTNSKAKAYAPDRYPNHSYTVRSSKIETNISNEILDSSSISFNLTYKNRSTSSIRGNVFVLFYDKNDNVIGLQTRSLYLNAGAADTSKITGYLNLMDGYDHYKIITRAYSSKLK